jgi:lipid A 4'-phosphatase
MSGQADMRIAMRGTSIGEPAAVAEMSSQKIVDLANVQSASAAPPPASPWPPARASTLRGALAGILAAGLATAVAFGFFPHLDLAIAALFYDPLHHDWPASHSALLAFHRNLSAYVAGILVIIAIAARVIGAVRRRDLALIPRRAADFLIGSLLLGPCLLVNVLLKPEWGRPRPAEVTDFGGKLPFVPWWDPYGQCSSNCSFVSGETSFAFWLIAWAFVVPRRYRPAAIAVALINCLVMSLGRMATGGHFTSDVLFAAVLTGLAIWVSYIAAFGDFPLWRRRRDLATLSTR